MNNLLKAFISLLTLITIEARANQNILIEALKQARDCSVSTYSQKNQIDCTFKLKDFHLSLAGVGQDDGAIGFLNSNFKGMYWGSVGRLHGCVIIKVGESHPSQSKHEYVKPAFVSPVNGVVYEDWQQCAKAAKK